MIYGKIQLEIINDKIKTSYLKEYEYKYGLGQTVYIVYKGIFGRYKIKEDVVSAFECTNIISYKLSNYGIATEDEIFDNIDDAVKYCDKKEKERKYWK